MQKRIITKLNCIDCKKMDWSIGAIEERGSSIIFGILGCKSCNAIYPIFDSVPIIISNRCIEAFLSNDVISYFKRRGIHLKNRAVLSVAEQISKQSGDNWQYQWKKIKDLYTRPRKNYFLTEESFLNFIQMERAEFKEKTVLVVGTGYGKELEHLKKYKCKDIFALDISRALIDTSKRFEKNENIHFIIADIMNLPFGKCFDIVIADHVLHHLPDVKSGVRGLVKTVNAGGIFTGNFYSYENNFLMRRFIRPIKKYILRFLPIRITYYLSIVPALLMWLIIKLLSEIKKYIPGLSQGPLAGHLAYYWSKLPFLWLWRGVIFDILQSPHEFFLKKNEIIKLFPERKRLKIKMHAGTMWRARYRT